MDATEASQFDELLTLRVGYFPAFYRHYLDPFLSQLKERIEQLRVGHSIDLDLERICRRAGSDLLDELIGLATRTLVFEFQTLRMADAQCSYSSFEQGIAEPDGRRAILAKYPALGTLLSDQVNARLDLLTIALERLLEDRFVVARNGLGEVKSIQELQCSTGDAHNGGRKVLIVEFSGGRVVYKPRSLKPELLAERVINLINGHLREDLWLRPPIAVDRGSYGWQQHVSREDCGAEVEVEQFFHRIGTYAALFRALGSTDMHFENLIAAGAHPMFIDLETLAEHHMSRSKPDDLNDYLAEELSDSILSTMLFPVRFAGSLFDINVAGLGSPYSERSSKWKNYAVVDVGTDLMRFEQASVLFEHGDNMVRLGSDPVDSAGYGDEIRAGYRAGAQSLRRSGQRLVSILNESRVDDLRMRQVLRPTAVYARFLEASTHPKYLANTSDRKRLFEKLGNPTKAPLGFQNEVLALEVAQMERGDVPYFYSRFESRSLEASVGDELVDFYPGSISDQIVSGVRSDRLSAQAMVRDEYLIQASLSTAVREPWTSGSRRSSFLMSNAPVDNLLDFASYVGEFFAQTAVWDSVGDSCSWITPLVADTDTVMLGPLNSTLYEGGGVLLFLAQLGRVTGQSEYTDLAIGGARAFPAWSGMEVLGDGRDISAFSGLGSSLYITAALKELTGDTGIAQNHCELRSIVQGLSVGADKADYVGGVAGLAVVLTKMQRSGNSQYLEVLGKIHALLRSSFVNSVTGPNDLAHGTSGIALGLSYTSVEFADVEAQSAVERYLANLLSDSSIAEWQAGKSLSWCKGKLGIAAAAVRSMTALGLEQDEMHPRIERLITECLANGGARGGDISLCHGRAGQIHSILQIADDLGRPDLRGRAEATMLQLLHESADGYIGGLANNSGMPTYMLGLAGVAHTALLLHDPNLPLSLSLDLVPAGIRSS